MASASSSHPWTMQHDAFSGIEPHGTRRRVDESSRLFEVFINHRGPDVKQTLALQLYNSLTDLGIHAFLDSKEKELGDSFPSTIENAIHSASAHIAIFSEGYAESPWCLAELVLMLQSSAKIIPLFYGVEPSALRYIEKGKYGKAFAKYEEKGRYMEKLKDWKEALQIVSFITGYEISNHFNDTQNIVSAVQKEVERKRSLHVAKYPVGLQRLVKDFERVCLDQLVEDFERLFQTNEDNKDKVQIVGIFGMGGVGKTTLAKELFNRKRSQYERTCFLFDVREAYANRSFPSLQMKFIKDLFQKDQFNFQSTEEGKTHIANCVERSNRLSFLIILDDIDHLQQLDSLLIMEMLKKSVYSLVIVTTRDVGVLINAEISAAYNLKGMDIDNARELFCWHSFDQPYPAEGYENLVNSFLNVCGGLPLSLQVLGSHVRGRDQSYWRLELEKIKKTLHRDIHQRLKISFDALDYEEQQIFMDIACFFVDKSKNEAMEIWEASGWSAQHALETLKNKCLVQEMEGHSKYLRMHDHLRDMGREIANSLSPPRLWRRGDLEYLESKGFKNILVRQTKARCFHSVYDESMKCLVTYHLGESDVCTERPTVLLWLKLCYRYCGPQPYIASWIPLQNLRYLSVHGLSLKTLWRSHGQAPTRLKELHLQEVSIKEFSDLSEIANSLEKITIDDCIQLKTMPGLSNLKKLIELNISSCSDLQELSVISLYSLETLILRQCRSLKIVAGISDLKKLVELNISSCSDLRELSVTSLCSLEKLVLRECGSLKIVTGISDLKKLVELVISRCPIFERLRVIGQNNLKRIDVEYSFRSASFEFDDCKNLETISGMLNIEKVASINIRACPKLEVLPLIQGPGNLETVTIDGCEKLKSLIFSECENLKRVMGKFDVSKLFIRFCPELEALPFLEGECGKLNGHKFLRYQNLKELCISDCWKLEDLTCSAHQTCLKYISIVRCKKLQNITLTTKHVAGLEIEKCRNLKREELNFDHRQCLGLQEFSNVTRLSCLKWINIHTCAKLHTIQGTDELHELESITIYNCPELQELSFSSLQTCLEKITIVRCGKLQSIRLPTKLVELEIIDCREIETVAAICNHNEYEEQNDLSSIAPLRCLKSIKSHTCDQLQAIQSNDGCGKFTVDGCRNLIVERCGKLKSLQLLRCQNLKHLSGFAPLRCLKSIRSHTCDRLQTIQGNDGCGKITVDGCGNLIVERCGKLKSLQLLRCQNFKQVSISDCGELEDLPCCASQTCLEKISIARCAKLQNITLPTNLVDLRIN